MGSGIEIAHYLSLLIFFGTCPRHLPWLISLRGTHRHEIRCPRCRNVLARITNRRTIGLSLLQPTLCHFFLPQLLSNIQDRLAMNPSITSPSSTLKVLFHLFLIFKYIVQTLWRHSVI